MVTYQFSAYRMTCHEPFTDAGLVSVGPVDQAARRSGRAASVSSTIMFTVTGNHDGQPDRDSD